jgi:heme-degrading monooxygenase HmoA
VISRQGTTMDIRLYSESGAGVQNALVCGAFVTSSAYAESNLLKETRMIARMWHGRVPVSKANAYREFLNQRAIPDYQSVAGNLSVHILERQEGEVTHFVTLTFWENMGVIRGVAGEAVEQAKYYPEDQAFLLEFEPTVVHYHVVGQSAQLMNLVCRSHFRR